jgi:serine/threonine protein kinase
VHGDVKPENVLLSADRQHAFLSDFGMSNVFAIQERFSTVAAGPPGGTTAYLSPEQIAENQQTPLSDIYAFAMIAYEMLTGHLPFDQTMPTFRQMSAKVTGQVDDPRRFNPRLVERTRAALLAGLSADPLKRPRSASELCRLLDDADERERASGASTEAQSAVVVSYSHKDAAWLDRVRVHLRPLERQGMLRLWSDTRIQPGSSWRDDIVRALDAASAAVLLVSSDFLASDFCVEEEFPRLLRAAADRGLKIIPVFLSPCRVSTIPSLAALEGVNSPSRTLIEMSPAEQERVLVALADSLLLPR